MKNSLIKVLSFVMALTMIVGCFSAITFSAADCAHENSEVVREEKATCADGGYTIYKCSDCGETYFGNYTPKSKEHTALTDYAATNATCTSPAKTAGIYCKDCMVNATNGDIDWSKAANDPTLKAPADVEGSVALGHKFVPVHVASDDCTVSSYDWYKCERCAKTPAEAYPDYDDEGSDDEDAEDFNEDYKVVFDGVNLSKKNITEAKSHNFTKVEIVTAVTTCADGLAKATCKDCGKTLEIVIPCTHAYGETVTGVAGTCAEVISGEQCSVCKQWSPETQFNTNVEHDYASYDEAAGNGEYGVHVAGNPTLIALGYTTEASLRKPATCTEGGFYVAVCKDCGTYAKIETKADGHKIKWELKNTLAPSTDADKAKYCSLAVKQVGKCTDCDYKPEEKVLIPAVEHVMETVSNADAITCGEQIETYTKCKNCTYNTEDAKVYGEIKAHVYGEWSTPAGSCKDGFIRTKTCSKCATSVDGHTVTETVQVGNEDAHTVADTLGDPVPEGSTMSYGSDIVNVKATCMLGAYSAYYCKSQYCDHKVKIESTQQEAKDPNNHVAGYKQVIRHSKAATCSTDGADFVECECGALKTVVVPKLNHKKDGVSQLITDEIWVKGSTIVTANPGDSSYKYINVEAIDGTCTRVGQTAGLVCGLCGVVTKAPVATTKGDITKAESHKDKVALGDGAVTATCISPAYTRYYCNDCKTEIKIYDGEPDADYHTRENEDGKKINLETIEAAEPSCGKAGNHEYVRCKTCKMVISVNVDDCEYGCTDLEHDTAESLLDPVIAAPEHKMKDQPAVPETCDEIGYTAFKACTVCGKDEDGEWIYTVGKRVIPAHGDKYLEKAPTAKAATCTSTGISINLNNLKGDKYCKKCNDNEKKVAVTVIDMVPHTYSEEGHATINAATNNNKYDCTLPTVQVEECTVCRALVIEDVTLGYESHNLELTVHKYFVKNNKVYLDNENDTGWVWACEKGTYSFQKCVRCSHEEKKDEKPAISHYIIDGDDKVEISLSCKDIASFEGEQCALCEATVDSDAEAQDGILTIQHNFITDEKAPTCTEVGYTVTVCIDCGLEKSRVETPALGGHEPSEDALRTGYLKDTVIEIVEATNVADGYILYRCPECKEEVKFVLKALSDITFTFDATPVASGNQVALNIYASAKDYAFNTIKIVLEHTVGMTLSTETKATLDYAFPTEDNVTIRATKNNSAIDSVYKTTTVLIYVPNGTDGKAAESVISGDMVKLATVYFDTLPYMPFAGIIDGDVEVFDIEGEEIDAAIEASEEFEENEGMVSLPKGDTNGDLNFDATDSVQIQSAIYSGEYDAALDFNNDGVVNLDDHVAFLKFYASEQTMYDYFELMSVDYMTYVNAYNLRVDLDGDKTITENDYNLIGVAMEELLKTEEGEIFVVIVGMDALIAEIVENIVVNGFFNGDIDFPNGIE